jgi:hypothetical protein
VKKFGPINHHGDDGIAEEVIKFCIVVFILICETCFYLTHEIAPDPIGSQGQF